MWLWNTHRKSNQTLTRVSKAASSSRESGPLKVSSSFIIPTVTVTSNTSVHTFAGTFMIFWTRESRLSLEREKSATFNDVTFPGASTHRHTRSQTHLSPEGGLRFSARTKVHILVKDNTLKTVLTGCENWHTTNCGWMGHRRQLTPKWVANITH